MVRLTLRYASQTAPGASLQSIRTTAHRRRRNCGRVTKCSHSFTSVHISQTCSTQRTTCTASVWDCRCGRKPTLEKRSKTLTVSPAMSALKTRRNMRKRLSFSKAATLVFASWIGLATHYGYACTISEDMADSLPLNSVEIPNADRMRIADMVIAAREWPDVEIRGIVYAGGYIEERDPSTVADQRASALRAYLIQLGVRESNVWVDKRTIKHPDVDRAGNKTLNQIAVTLVPICAGGCERLCNDQRVSPNSKIIK